MSPMVVAFFAGSTLLELGMMQNKKSILKQEQRMTEMQFQMQREQVNIASLQNQIAIDRKLRSVLSAQNVLLGMQTRRRSGSTIALQEKSVSRAEEAKSFEKLNKSIAMSELNLQATQSSRQYSQAIGGLKMNMLKTGLSAFSSLDVGGGFSKDLFVGGR